MSEFTYINSIKRNCYSGTCINNVRGSALGALSARDLSFALSMGALGNVLAAVTIAPTMVQQVALDFSSLPAFIVAVFGGPVLGALTGFIAGILPSAFFGFIGGQLGILGLGTSVGKAISGFSVGLLTRMVKPSQNRTTFLIPIVLLGFAPEAIWIYILFTALIPVFIPQQAFLSAFVVPILAKAWFEVAVMSVFTSAIAGHSGFRAFLAHYVRTTALQSRQSN